MRGLLVDRPSQRAYAVSRLGRLDEGNFLTHAIAEGRIASIRWGYPVQGGRQYDVGTIRYTTDLTAQPLRWLLSIKGQKAIPIQYEAMECQTWNSFGADEFLDIDWDFFASRDYPLETIADRTETFLNTQFTGTPRQISVCYSPRFSHPSRQQFETFADRLAHIFKAEIVQIEAPPVPESRTISDKNSPGLSYRRLRYQFRHALYEANLWLRRRGIY